MSTASSSADMASGTDGLAGAGGADGALTVHCFSCSIILTRREMSRSTSSVPTVWLETRCDGHPVSREHIGW